MDIKDLAPDQLADFFRKGQRAAEQEQRQDEHDRLVRELDATKEQSRSAFDRRAELKGEITAAEERIEEADAEVARAQSAAEAPRKERAELGRRASNETRAGKDLVSRGRKLEEALGMDLEERGFGQHGWFASWPQGDNSERPKEI